MGTAHKFRDSRRRGREEGICMKPFIDLTYPRKGYTQNFCRIVWQFRYYDVCNELGGQNSNVRKLQNIMTLSNAVHRLFDEPRVWLEATVGRMPSLPPSTAGSPPEQPHSLQSASKRC